MSKKILAIVSSPRKDGNSETLTDRFIKGAAEAGNTVEKLCLRDKKSHLVLPVKSVLITAETAYKRTI